MRASAVCLCVCLVVNQASVASGSDGPPLPSGDQSWYYAIGGADPVSIQNPLGASKTLNGHPLLNLRYSCGKFDLTTSVTNAFKDVVNGFKNKIMATAKGAIAALPLYVFQRAQPGLYELFQSYSADFKLDFDTSVQSCEDFEREILAGNDPYHDLIQAAKAAAWKVQMTSTTDAVQAKRAVDATGGNLGVPYPDVSSGTTHSMGGAGQPPLQPIRGAAEAGWNVLLGRAPSSNAPYTPPSGVNMRMVQIFPTPADAGRYAVDVLGDARARTCEGCFAHGGIPGNGLGPKYDAHRKTIATDLAALVGGTGTPSAADLKKVSAPGVAITGRVVEALRALPPDERSIMTGRLAADVAMARTIEEAFTIRRMLLAAKRVPEVAANEVASNYVDEAVEEIEQEIDSFLFEQRVSKEIASNTASAVIARLNELNVRSDRVVRQNRPAKTHLDTRGRFK